MRDFNPAYVADRSEAGCDPPVFAHLYHNRAAVGCLRSSGGVQGGASEWCGCLARLQRKILGRRSCAFATQPKNRGSSPAITCRRGLQLR
jgi:hypothetical protein